MGYVVRVEKGIALSNGLMLDQRGKTIMGASHRYYSLGRLSAQASGPSRSRKPSFQNQLEKFGPLTIKPWSTDFALKHLPGTVLVLSNSHFNNYFHYLYDVISRLALIEEQLDSYQAIYVRNKMPYQKQYLSLLGLDNKQIISADQEMPVGITAERLVMPCYSPIEGYTLDPKIIGFLRRKLLPYADSALNRGERIYITRRKARYRRILNEQKLLQILAEYGFSVICLEDCSVDEQISVMKFANVIVSLHGAGLSNLLYCDPGTKVLEIFSGLNVECFFAISASLGLEYSYLSGIGGNEQFVKLTDDATIDPDVFRREIELLC